jgi:hypothetical protein
MIFRLVPGREERTLPAEERLMADQLMTFVA